MNSSLLKWGIWAFWFIFRVVLIVLGWVLPVHIGYETERTKDLNLWERYLENSWRNPTPYLRDLMQQPIPEVKPNPDDLVRKRVQKKATRYMESGPFVEYWSLSNMGNGRYWEFRIGWKFVDGDDTFWPTLQVGPKK